MHTVSTRQSALQLGHLTAQTGIKLVSAVFKDESTFYFRLDLHFKLNVSMQLAFHYLADAGDDGVINLSGHDQTGLYQMFGILIEGAVRMCHEEHDVSPLVLDHHPKESDQCRRRLTLAT